MKRPPPGSNRHRAECAHLEAALTIATMLARIVSGNTDQTSWPIPRSPGREPATRGRNPARDPSPCLSIESPNCLAWPVTHCQASERPTFSRPGLFNRLQATENGLRRNDVSPGVDLRLWACLAILEAADAMRADTIRPTPGRGDKASIDGRVLQTGALQGIIRIPMRAEACASTAFAVSHDHAGPDWLWGVNGSGCASITHLRRPINGSMIRSASSMTR